MTNDKFESFNRNLHRILDKYQEYKEPFESLPKMKRLIKDRESYEAKRSAAASEIRTICNLFNYTCTSPVEDERILGEFESHIREKFFNTTPYKTCYYTIIEQIKENRLLDPNYAEIVMNNRELNSAKQAKLAEIEEEKRFKRELELKEQKEKKEKEEINKMKTEISGLNLNSMSPEDAFSCIQSYFTKIEVNCKSSIHDLYLRLINSWDFPEDKDNLVQYSKRLYSLVENNESRFIRHDYRANRDYNIFDDRIKKLKKHIKKLGYWSDPDFEFISHRKKAIKAWIIILSIIAFIVFLILFIAAQNGF